MTQLNIIKTVSYGAFLWLIITGLIGAVYGFGIYFDMVDSPLVGLVAALIAGGIALIFAKEVGIATTKQATAYSLLWLLIPVILDLIIVAQLTAGVFNSWQYWLGHVLVFLSPWFVLWGDRKTSDLLYK